MSDILVETIKNNVDIVELARKLGMTVNKTNHCSLHPADKTPSCHLNPAENLYCELNNGNQGGDQLKFAAIALGLDINNNFPEVLEWFVGAYGLQDIQKQALENYKQANNFDDKPKWKGFKGFNALLTWNAAKKEQAKAIDYLVNERCLDADLIKKHLKKSFGYTDYTSSDPSKKDEYGPAIVFPMMNSNMEITAINQRYIADNHLPRMRIVCTKDTPKTGLFYSPNFRKVLSSKFFVIVEAPIDAMTLEISGCPSIATLTTALMNTFPIDWIKPEQQVILWPDNDENGAGQKAMNGLYHRLITSGKIVNFIDLPEYNDVNAMLKSLTQGEQEIPATKAICKQVKTVNTDIFPVKLPFITNPFEFATLSKFKCYSDSVNYEYTEIQGKGKDKHEVTVTRKVAGFRIYRLTSINLHSPKNAFNKRGFSDKPNSKVLVQFKNTLSKTMQHVIFEQKDVGNMKKWEECGVIHNTPAFKEYVASISRDNQHQIDAINLIGLVYLNGKLTLNDADNTYLTTDNSLYYNMRFNSNNKANARIICNNLQRFYPNDHGILFLIWVLGSFLKVFLGFYPHAIIMGDTQAGKTTMIELFEKLLGIESSDSTMLTAAYKPVKALSNSFFPMVFDETQEATDEQIKYLSGLLNSAYDKGKPSPRGTTNREFYISSPVAVFGRDWKYNDSALLSKSIQIPMENIKNDNDFDYDPDQQFPVKEYAEWIINNITDADIQKMFKDEQDKLLSKNKGFTKRFTQNYTAMKISWRLIVQFAGMSKVDSIERINSKIDSMMVEYAMATNVEKNQAVAILSVLATLITLESYSHLPYKIENGYLYFHPGVAITYLEQHKKAFPIKTSNAFIKVLKKEKDLLVAIGISKKLHNGQKLHQQQSCIKLSLAKMAELQVDWPI